MPDPDAERLDALEIRVAFQERTIEELNGVVLEQWKVVAELQRQFARVEDRLREAEASLADSSAPEPPPPHY